MRASDSDPMIDALLRLTGAPKNVRAFELRAAVGKAVTVRCEYFPERQPKQVLKVRDNFKWITPAARKEVNAYLLEVFGARDCDGELVALVQDYELRKIGESERAGGDR